MPIYQNPTELASLQSGKKLRGPGSKSKNDAASEAKKDLTKFIGRIRLDIDASWKITEPWRLNADESYKFVENEQWDPKDISFIQQNAPSRPIMTFNDILPIVRVLSGIERQKAESFKVKPREGGDVDSAQVLTELIQYVDDENLGFYQRIRKSNDVNITGRGYIKTDVSYDENVNGDIILKRLNPLTIFNDPMADAWDGTDRRWVAEAEWVTEDEAKELWPEFEDQIKVGEWLAAQTGGSMPAELMGDHNYNQKLFLDQATKRVRIFDYWYKKLEKIMLAVNMDTGDTRPVDDDFLGEYKQMPGEEQQALKFIRRKVTTIRVATLMNWLLMRDDLSPFSHRYFPITPYIGLQFQGEPNGIVHYLKDPQRLENKGVSQAMNHLNRSANSGWLNHATRGAVTSVLEKFGSVPGVVINYQEEKPQQIDPAPLSAGHVELTRFAKEQIKNTSLVNAEIQGISTGSRTTSGRAIQARQQGGLVGNEDLFDNGLLGDKIVGLQLISLIQDRFTPARVERIVQNLTADTQTSSLAQIMATKRQQLPLIIDKALKEEYDYIIDRTGGGFTAREELGNRLEKVAEMWAQTGTPVPVSLVLAVIRQLDIPSTDAEAIKQEVMQMHAQAQQQMAGPPPNGGPPRPGMPPGMPPPNMPMGPQ